MSEETNRELTIVRFFDAPRERVFKAWIDPEQVVQWWGPKGVTNPVCKIDARPGGAIEIVMLAGEELGELKGSEWPMTGTFQEVIPPEKLVYISSPIIDDKPVMKTHNTVTFEEVDSKTKLTLHIVASEVSPEAEGPLAGMKMGWTQSIDKLGSFIAKS